MTISWSLKPGEGFGSLQKIDAAPEPIGPHGVRVALRAMSLNARDVMIALGHSPLPAAQNLIPVSDGAGTVVEVGDGVDRFAVGDRVVIAFNPAHLSGPYHPTMEPSALGGVAQGLLREEAVLDQSALVHLPDSVSFEQAACLPCVGVVAWNALYESGTLVPGQTVVATGTGNVSLIAAQLASAGGARVGVTSSDDAKIERAKELGADFGVNYRQHEEWEVAVREATGGAGADVVLENAGPPSIARSIRATAFGGRVMQIGFKATDGPPVSVVDVMLGGVTVKPVMVGSRAMLERLVAAVAANDIRVPIHASFGLLDAPDAFTAYGGRDVFGKVVITNNSER